MSVTPDEKTVRLQQSLRRATSFVDAMERMKYSPGERLSRLREDYAHGRVTLKEFESRVYDLIEEEAGLAS